MADTRGSWAVWGIAGLCALMIVAGLFITGGPGQGRIERRDDTRRDDLYRLHSHASCIALGEGRVDGNLDATPTCPEAPRLVDPFTDQPYVIEVVDAQHLRLCAEFEQAQDSRQAQWREGPGEWRDGCLVAALTLSE